MTYTTSDYIVLGIIFIFCMIGFFRGFIKILFTLSKGLITFGGAYLLSNPVAGFITKTGVTNNLNTKIAEWIAKQNPVFSEAVSEGSADIIAESLNLPSFINKYISTFINSYLQNNPTVEMTLGEVVSNSLTSYAVMAISFLLLTIVLGIIVKFLFKLVERLFDVVGFRFINKLLGFIFGAVLGYVCISVIFFIFGLVGGFVPAIQNIIDIYIDPSNTQLGFARFFYNNNLISILIENLIIK